MLVYYEIAAGHAEFFLIQISLQAGMFLAMTLNLCADEACPTNRSGGQSTNTLQIL
jgi:hypothetical protein